MRKAYNPLGFSKGYNFVLCKYVEVGSNVYIDQASLGFLTVGYMFGFTLSRLEYFSYHGIFCNPNSKGTGASPGECYYWLQSPYKIGTLDL
jgi:hypothetical protein